MPTYKIPIQNPLSAPKSGTIVPRKAPIAPNTPGGLEHYRDGSIDPSKLNAPAPRTPYVSPGIRTPEVAPNSVGGYETIRPAPKPGETGTSSDMLIRDLPTPTIPQSSSDQMFLEGIRGKPMGELTPEEINRLLQIEKTKAESQGISDLQGYYDPLLSDTENQIKRAQEAYDSGQLTEQQKMEAEINRTFGLVDQKYAPEIRRINEAGERQVEDTQRSFSFSGTGRGSRADEARQVVIEKNNEIMNAKNAEIALEKRLLQAQIKGESDAVIKGLADSLEASKAKRTALEGEQAANLSNLKATLATQGQSSVQTFLQTLQTQASLNTYDPNLSSATGQIVDSTGKPILGPDGKPLTAGSIPPEASADISKQLGYLADKNGGAILDTNGQPIPINKAVKNTFQDGAKNTYILYEDGSVQQIGATGGSGGGYGGGSGSGGAYNDTLAPIYEDISNYANTYGVSLSEAVDALGLSSNSAIDRENYITGTAMYLQNQMFGAQQQAAPGLIPQGVGSTQPDAGFQGLFPIAKDLTTQYGPTVLDSILGSIKQSIPFVGGDKKKSKK